MNDIDDNEWTDICRVCLGPTEEGFPLHKPCICTGTIGFVHQNCLEATIAEKRVDKCPVCNYKYKFSPQYAENAPEQLSKMEVLSGLILRATYRWTPLALRVLLSMFIWLILLPLLTAYIYQAWMYKPSSVSVRWTRNLLWNDIISGVIITATIILSFLSLMSLADHFRFHWQPQAQRQREQQEQQRNNNLPQNEQQEGNNDNNDLAALLQEQRGQQAAREDVANAAQVQQDQKFIGHSDDDDDDDGIIPEELQELLKGVIEHELEFSNDNVENGFMSSGEEEEDDDDDEDLRWSLLSTGDSDGVARSTPKRRKLEHLKSSSTSTINTNMKKEEGEEGDEKTFFTEHNEDSIKLSPKRMSSHKITHNYHADQRRKSLGVMDEGQTIFSDDMKTQRNSQRDNQRNLFEVDGDINDSDFRLHSLKNDESFSSLTDNLANHNEDGHNRNSVTGTPLRRQRERELLQRQILEKIDIDVEESSSNLSDNVDRTKSNIQGHNFGNNSHENDYLATTRESPGSKKEKFNSVNGEISSCLNSPISSKRDVNSVDEEFERMMKLQEEAEQQQNEEDDDLFQGFGHPRNDDDEQDDDDPDQFEPLDAALGNQDQMDMDMAMPIGELIGLHGPISAVFRNLLWFLAFNTAYLGLFGCVPRMIGGITYSQYSASSRIISVTKFFFAKCLFLSFVPFSNDDIDSKADIDTVLTLLNEENEKRNNLIQASDVAKIVLGYLSLALSIFIMHAFFSFYTKTRPAVDDDRVRIDERVNNMLRMNIEHLARLEENRNHLDELDGNELDGNDDLNLIMSEKLLNVLECISAIAKVSVLIFLKMSFLPLLLGMWLDISTLAVFKSCIKERVIFAGTDLVGFFLLHWVVGITFMMTVTISVLQFREILHPDILARIIRPQEPQPDLIGNLLQDSGWTHTKRVLPSLGIYAALLALHVWLPARILSWWGIDVYIPLFQPKLWYILSQAFQIPIELLAFHLCMLSFIEKYKNRIGEIQHRWLLKVCWILDLTDELLPRSISKFKLIATIPLKKNQDDSPLARNLIFSDGKYKSKFIDPFWERLMALQEKGVATEEFVEANLGNYPPLQSEEANLDVPSKGSQTADPFYIHIPLPIFEKVKSNSSAPVTFSKKMLPPRVGSYGFRKQRNMNNTSDDVIIEVWKEVIGEPISRPPEGWDYLGEDGGAVDQGRWAWGKEIKSDVENAVARRKRFFPYKYKDNMLLQPWRSGQFWLSLLPIVIKVSILCIFAWATVSVCIYGVFTVPLAIGRSLFQVLRVHDDYTHDPFVFAVGSLIFFPPFIKLTDFVCTTKENSKDSERVNLFSMAYQIGVRQWKGLFMSPRKKIFIFFQTGVLWLLISPLLLGLNYDLFLLKVTSFWAGELQNVLSLDAMLSSWLVGFVILHLWAILCFYGAFRKDFWAQPGILAPNENNDNENNADRDPTIDADHTDINDERFYWQGKNGIVHRCATVAFSVIFHQEWILVDKTMLLEEFTFPIIKRLFYLLVGPIASSYVCTFLLHHWFSSDTFIASSLPMHRMILHRWFSVSAIIIAIAHAFQHPIGRWFRVAHKVARDQRYLLGRILLDRTP